MKRIENEEIEPDQLLIEEFEAQKGVSKAEMMNIIKDL